MLARLWIVFQKELLDSLRDRRVLLNSLGTALLGPAMLLMIFFLIAQLESSTVDRAIELPVVGIEAAPDLAVFLEQNNVVLQPLEGDPVTAVENGDADVVLVISADYSDQFAIGFPAAVELVSDTSRNSASRVLSRMFTLLEGYNSMVGGMRLQARGISPSVVVPVSVGLLDTATPQSQAASLLSLLPYFIIFAVFIGGMALIIDMTVGERERGSLEPLLINPVERSSFVIGKLLAAIASTTLSVLVTLIGFAGVINFTPLDRMIGIQLSLDPLSFVAIFLISFPIIILACALQMIIASAASSVKEAQSYLAFLPLLPALPGLILAFIPLQIELWMMFIPTFGQQVLINQLLRGESAALLNIFVSTAFTLVVAIGLVWWATRQFGSERTLFKTSKA